MTQQISFVEADKPQLEYIRKEDKPSGRVIREPGNCTRLELYAVIIGGPNQIEIATVLNQRFPTLGDLRQAAVADLLSIKGIGVQAAARLRASLALLGQYIGEQRAERVRINCPADGAACVQFDMMGLQQEELWVLLLNTRNEVISIDHLYKGSINTSQIRVAEIFKAAIRANATSVIPVHNHPSGDATPSPDDVAVTRAIVQAGKLLDIEVLDHLIVGGGRYVSLKDRGLGFS